MTESSFFDGHLKPLPKLRHKFNFQFPLYHDFCTCMRFAYSLLYTQVAMGLCVIAKPLNDNRRCKMSQNPFPPVPFDEFDIPSYEEWKEEAIKALKGEDFDRRLLTKTFEGITLKPIYTYADMQGESRELPGFAPYKRGTTSGGYVSGKWHMAQQVQACSPSEIRELVTEELASGADAISLSISSASKGLPGHSDGANIFDVADVKDALGGVINFENYGIYINTGPSPYPFVQLLAEAKGCFARAKGGHVGGSPLGILAHYGKLPRSVSEIYDEMSESVKLVQEVSPNIRPVVVDGNIYADGGADSVTEIACVMAEVSEYMQALTERGICPSNAAKSIGVSISLGSNFFMEIAKIRAARVLFAQIAEAFGADKEAAKANIHGTTSKFNKSIYDPYVNVLRLSTEAFSGVVGGLDALTILPFDSPMGTSSAHSRRISRNHSIMMAEEFGLGDTIDPAGGSYYVEKLTDEFVERAWDKFMEYEDAGGFYQALLKGMPQEAIAKVLADKKSKMATRQQRLVGVNMYVNAAEKIDAPKAAAVTAAKAPSGIEADINPAVVREAFKKGINVFDVYDKINDCHGGCAKKETCNPDCAPIPPVRLAEDFENVRQKTVELGGVSVLLLNMGTLAQYKGRADFSAAFFETGGFSVKTDQIFTEAADAIKAVASDRPDVCVICSSDDMYPELVPVIAKGVRENAPNTQIILAGMPAAEHKDTYFEAGLTDFIHIRSNCLEVLENVQKRKAQTEGR